MDGALLGRFVVDRMVVFVFKPNFFFFFFLFFPQFLQFAQGTVIDVLEQDESGWWEGMCDGLLGIFPGGFVEVFELIAEDGTVTQVRCCCFLVCC